MTNLNKKNIAKAGGFGLMEMVIAIGIVAFVFVGIMSLLAYNIRIELINRDKVIASYLAQEAIETVRQMRDNNWFSGGGAGNWDQGIPSQDHLVISAKDPNNLSQGWDLVQSGSTDSYKHRIFLLNGNYVQTADNNYNDSKRPATWQSTKFKRLITIEKPSNHQMKITVVVYYGESANVQVVSYLYNNWYIN